MFNTNMVKKVEGEKIEIPESVEPNLAESTNFMTNNSPDKQEKPETNEPERNELPVIQEFQTEQTVTNPKEPELAKSEEFKEEEN